MAIRYVYTGQPMTGTADDEFFIAYKGSTGTDSNTINAGGGDDWVVADSSDTWIPSASYLNGSIANAFNLETLTSTWTTSENPLFGDFTVPHTTVIAEATIGQSEFYRIAVGAGQKITIDIDYGSNTATGVPRDLVVELQDSLGNVIVTADDSLVTDGGLGSFPSTPGSASSYDPYLSYTVANAGIYYINVRPFGGGPGSTFTENNTFVMDVSVTGHAVAATNPVMGSDTIDGGAGNDSLFGQGGNDVINGGDGDDLIDGGSGGDIIHGDDGNDTLYGGDGSEENIHGDDGNDILHSGGEGHYYGDNGDDLIYAGITAGVNEILDGGAGTDTLDTTSWNGTYVIDLITGITNFGESFINFENVITGNGPDTITGTAAANVINTRGGIDTVFGGGGDDVIAGGADGDTLDGESGADTLDYSLSNAAVTVSLLTNSASGGHATGDIISNFENIIGSVLGDNLTGSAVANSLDGKGGADTMDGGAGSDWYYVDNISDVVIETVGNGAADRVLTSVSYALAVGAEIEIFTTTNNAGTGAINLTGNEFSQTINGNAGANILDGGKGGNDTMNGLGGDDTFFAWSGADTFNGGNGTDTVSFAGWASGVSINLDLIMAQAVPGGSVTLSSIETVIGGNGADTLRGSTGANVLSGGNGNDTFLAWSGADTFNGGNGTDTVSFAGWTSGVTINLDLTNAQAVSGGSVTVSSIETVIGGNGADTLRGSSGVNVLSGGNGNDTFLAWSGADTFNGGSGTDTVSFTGWGSGVTINLDLATAQAVSGGSVTLSSIETIVGGNGADTLRGSTGANVLSGGAGNDTFLAWSGADMFSGDNGTDTVSFAGWGSGVSINLDLATAQTVAGGSVTLSSIENVIGGNGNDVLRGSTGNNLLSGGNGNDTFLAWSGADTFNGGSGTDTVSFTGWGSGVSINLDLATAQTVSGGSVTLSSIENIIGGNGADTLRGSTGANVMSGGAGNDTLQGFGGQDTFAFDAALGASNIDTITDFSVADDTIRLEDAVFTGLVHGTLTASAFVIGAAAADALDRIIYDSATGNLYFDDDGNGAHVAQQFAHIVSGLAMTNADFYVV